MTKSFALAINPGPSRDRGVGHGNTAFNPVHRSLALTQVTISTLRLARERRDASQTANDAVARLAILPSEDDADLGVAAHHSRVGFGRFFERICFNHGAYAG